MATRSTITIKQENGNSMTVYCHWDGYPSNNGKILLNHYKTLEKVQELINLGDLSSLDESIEKPEGHSFDNKIDGYSVFYHRDRGENWKDVKPTITKKSESLIDILNNKYSDCEYNYMFDVETSTWLYKKAHETKFDLLTKKVIKE